MRPKEVDGKFPGEGSILSDCPEVEAGLGADGSKETTVVWVEGYAGRW